MKPVQYCLLLSVLTTSVATVHAQQLLRGRVLQAAHEEALPGTSLTWLATGQTTVSGKDGTFSLQIPGMPGKLAVAHAGYQADTLVINTLDELTIRLRELVLSEVVVKGQKPGTFVHALTPVKTEVITQTELKKAACCDLAGCFETQASVQPQTTNIITNSKELRILGLSGVYNQILVEGMPLIQGATFTYGISTIPGSLVDNIYVSKGANSVLQGYESISGQINVELREPEKSDRLYLNGYINNFGEKHLNANVALSLGKWQSLTAVHLVQPAGKFDRDDDDFLDLPRLTRYMVWQKFKLDNEGQPGWKSSVSFRYLNEQRTGGQWNFDPDTDNGSPAVYGQTVQFNQAEAYTKTEYRLDETRNLAFMISGCWHDQTAWFGTTRYQPRQVNAYANAQYELTWGDGHELKTGLSLRYQDLFEAIRFSYNPLGRTFAGDYQKQEIVPGAFAENIFYLGNWTLIAGLRADRLDSWGWFATPRALVKYDFSENTNVRLSAGTGRRTVNLFSENIGLLVSSRDIVFAEKPEPEKAFNTGLNFMHTWRFDEYNLTLSLDAYHTRFLNQIFPDYDVSTSKAVISNFRGTSISNSGQADLKLTMPLGFEFKAAYNYLDVYRMINGEKVALPFNATHKLLFTGSYQSSSKLWKLDANVHWYGRQRLPDTRDALPQYRQEAYSKPFLLVSAQVTRTWNRLELYLGCENIADFRQLRPIVSWQDPFGPSFDTSFAWGPTRGREIYFGFRYKIPWVKED